MRVVWANYKTIISMLAILLMGAGIAVLGKSALEVWLPTPTPPTSQASVYAFLVTKANGLTSTAEPGTTITARVEEVVQIKVEVSMTDEDQEEDLVFTWYTCRTENGPVLQRVGNPAMLYVTPSEPGPDCICVVVEKGGVQLDKQEIFVNVQE